MQKIHDFLNISDEKEIPKSNNSVSVIEDISPLVIGQSLEIEDDAEDVQLEQDFRESIENIKDVVSIAKNAAQKVFDIAQDSESDKDFSALNQLLKNVTDSSKTIIDIYKTKIEYKEKKKKIKLPDPALSETSQNNNNIKIDKAIFTGNSNQLFDYIQKKKGEQ